ncbi:hypothetical protein HDU97_006216 [Phlyctochytrium planicorne]|nr:hypothetical protein HDU97_006216 [Phlyctochytrium planicorne]
MDMLHEEEDDLGSWLSLDVTGDQAPPPTSGSAHEISRHQSLGGGIVTPKQNRQTSASTKASTSSSLPPLASDNITPISMKGSTKMDVDKITPLFSDSPSSLIRLDSAWSTSSASVDSSQNDEDDLLGLGSFDQVFVTEEDLKRAREKLPDEQHKTKEDLVVECLRKVDTFRVLAQAGKREYTSGTNTRILESNEIDGKALDHDIRLLIIPLDDILTLEITYTSLLNIRTKNLPDASNAAPDWYSAVMLTVQGEKDLYFQILVADDESAERCADALETFKKALTTPSALLNGVDPSGAQVLEYSPSTPQSAPQSTPEVSRSLKSTVKLAVDELNQDFICAKQELILARDRAIAGIEEAFRKGLQELRERFGASDDKDTAELAEMEREDREREDKLEESLHQFDVHIHQCFIRAGILYAAVASKRYTRLIREVEVNARSTE